MIKGLMDIGDVNEYLGWSEDTIKVLIEEQKFPGMMIDDDWFFSRSLIDKWVEEFVDTFKGQILKKEALESGRFEMKGEKLKGGLASEEEMEESFDV